MAAGYKDFTAGSTLAAADLEDYCELQTVMRFASAAARDTALSGVLTEGLRAHLLDTNTETVYSGSAWSTVGPAYGALTSYTPTLTQSGSVTFTGGGKYQRIGRMVHYTFELAATASGTGANAVTITLPVTALGSSTTLVIGNGLIYDLSATLAYPGHIVFASTTTLQFRPSDSIGSATGFLGTSVFTAALASGDLISGSVFYEAASDA